MRRPTIPTPDSALNDPRRQNFQTQEDLSTFDFDDSLLGDFLSLPSFDGSFAFEGDVLPAEPSHFAGQLWGAVDAVTTRQELPAVTVAQPASHPVSGDEAEALCSGSSSPSDVFDGFFADGGLAQDSGLASTEEVLPSGEPAAPLFIRNLGPVALCHQNLCNLQRCKATLFRKGIENMRELNRRHPGLLALRDKALKTQSKRDRRQVKYPARAREVYRAFLEGRITEEDFNLQPKCIREELRKLQKEEQL